MGSQTDASLDVGQRVFCTPAGLTGEVIGKQGEWVGVRFDLGYITWESPADLRPARPGESTGTRGLPPGDPLYADQRARIDRSEKHTGFDNSNLLAAISQLGDSFRTKDLSTSQRVLNAHPFAATTRNYHDMLGRHLSKNEGVLGVRQESDADHPRGALWRREAVASNGSRSPAQGGPGRTNVEAQVDACLKSMGIAQPAALRDEHGWWSIQYGSSRGRIGILQVDDTPYLRVTAHVVDLPAAPEMQLRLCRELLDFNLGLPGAVRAGTAGEAVFVASTVPAESLDDEEVASVIGHTFSTADELMRPLQQRYANAAAGPPS